MNEPKRSIFRADVYKRYLEGKEKAVLPKLVSPPVFAVCWVLVGLLFIGAGLAWFARVPTFASGDAVIVHKQFELSNRTDDVVAVAFFPPETFPRLRVGERVFLRQEQSGERLERSIIAVPTRLSSPEAAIREFGLSDGAAQRITKPVAVAVIRFGPAPEGLPAEAYVGSVYRAEMQTGSRRVMSLLPTIGRLTQSSE
ncbi:MAG TPA: hypothetical protein VF713_04085 [Thermoanaerobaculia bacterium]